MTKREAEQIGAALALLKGGRVELARLAFEAVLREAGHDELIDGPPKVVNLKKQRKDQ